jgi:hypothetical protein
MPDWSRRHALRTVAGTVALALAGCSSVTTGSDDDPPVLRERITDVEVSTARRTDGDPLFVAGGGEPDRDDDARSPRVREIHHLTDESDLERLRFRDGAADLQGFVTGTDLESKSVYLVQRPIGECYVPRLRAVFREGEGVDADFGRDLRPAGFACDVDACDMVAVAIRLPFADDGFNSVGFSPWGSDCEHRSTASNADGGDGT